MACYRNGGCGPYENRSCSECPASKPEYAQRYRETANKEAVSIAPGKQKYILKAYYLACNGQKTLAELVVTDPVKVEDGIWATSENIYGGESRHFYRACDVVALNEK